MFRYLIIEVPDSLQHITDKLSFEEWEILSVKNQHLFK